MATFGDLRSMVASRDWARWYEIDLRELDVPHEAAQAYVRPHVMDALWGVPLDDSAYGRICHWPQGHPVTDSEERICVYVKTPDPAELDLWAYGHVVADEVRRICDHIGALIDRTGDAPRLYTTGRLTYACSRSLYGEAAQAEAALMRCAALLARGWPVTLEHAKAAIQPRPSVPSGVPHACFVAAEVREGGA